MLKNLRKIYLCFSVYLFIYIIQSIHLPIFILKNILSLPTRPQNIMHRFHLRDAIHLKLTLYISCQFF